MANSAGDRLDSLLVLMSRLRGEGGCPWDREQTRESLKPFLIEEAYEVVDAIDEASRDHLVEELGDLLFQVVFHCQLGVERGEFTMVDVLEQICDKMVRRHPHVFGGARVEDARAALAQWERIKRDETDGAKAERSALDGVPRILPALLRAQRVQAKASRVGFDWPAWRQAWAKLREEVDELEAVLDGAPEAQVDEELGDVLFSIVNVARLRGLDAEDSLRRATSKFTRRFSEVEAEMRAAGREMTDVPMDELDRAWEAAKRREREDRRGSGIGR